MPRNIMLGIEKFSFDYKNQINQWHRELLTN
jgi:hypothetical protein